jgi:hypothetical protein
MHCSRHPTRCTPEERVQQRTRLVSLVVEERIVSHAGLLHGQGVGRAQEDLDLRVIHVGADVDDVTGLQGRVGPELVEVGRDLVVERAVDAEGVDCAGDGVEVHVSLPRQLK